MAGFPDSCDWLGLGMLVGKRQAISLTEPVKIVRDVIDRKWHHKVSPKSETCTAPWNMIPVSSIERKKNLRSIHEHSLTTLKKRNQITARCPYSNTTPWFPPPCVYPAQCPARVRNGFWLLSFCRRNKTRRAVGS